LSESCVEGIAEIPQASNMDERLFIHDRWTQILRLINPDLVTSVEKLAEVLSVSPATIRRDLIELHELGKLLRVRGGAIAFPPADGGLRAHGLLEGQADDAQSATTNMAAKRAIGEYAVGLLSEGEAIIIDGGTTTMEMARRIPDQNLTVLTTSVSIMSNLLGKTQLRILITGGEVFQKQNIVLNPYGDGILQNFSASKLFIGAQAVTRQGLMQTDPLLVQNEQSLIARADSVILLADSSKFDASASLSVCSLETLDMVVTDSKVSSAAVTMLESFDIEVVQVRTPEK